MRCLATSVARASSLAFRGTIVLCAVVGTFGLQVRQTRAQEPDSQAQRRFDSASEAMVRGENSAAARQLQSIAEEFDDDKLADDALFAAAQLYEEKLAQPAQAAALYQRLLDRYPRSRTALAAKRRLTRLHAALGPDSSGAQALAGLNDILYGDPNRPVAESIGLMTKLIAEHDTWAGLPDALIWLGDAYVRDGNSSDARLTFERIADRWPNSDQAFEALRRAALLALETGDYRRAAGYVERMRVNDIPSRKRSRDDTVERVELERVRHTLYQLSFAALALVVLVLGAVTQRRAGSWRDAGLALIRPPGQLLYMIPVALLLLAAALTGHPAMAPAVGIIAAGGLVLTWLHGVAIRLLHRRTAISLLTLATIVAVVATCYIALHRTRLLDLLARTVRFGPDVQ